MTSQEIIVRQALASDHAFILSLSPTLAEVAKLTWHNDSVVQKMQDDYILSMLNQKDKPHTTLIAEENSKPIGFIHACSREDEISGETCGTIPLLAISKEAQGKGVGKTLIEHVENWSKKQGFRLLHLEVFANNENAYNFYQKLAFKPEVLHMVKTLT